MIKSSFFAAVCWLILCVNSALADYSFTLSSSAGFQVEIIISEEGEVSYGGPPPADQPGQETLRSIEASLRGIDLYQDSISSARDRITSAISQNIGNQGGGFDVAFNAQSTRNNPFIRDQQVRRQTFESEALDNVLTPSFKSDFLGEPIFFDVNSSDDLDALRVFFDANFKQFDQLQQNQTYREAKFTSRMIEIRQSKKDSLTDDVLNTLTDAARAMLEDNAETFLQAFEILTASNEFQTGLAASLANNFNPVSFAYPIEASCDSASCEAGLLVGDILSTLVGTYEIANGLALTVGSGGGGLAVTATSGGVLGPVALPASAAGVATGIAMAGHGLTTVGNSITHMYSRLESDGNLSNAKKSEELSKRLDKDELERLENFVKDTGLDTGEFEVELMEALADEKITNAVRNWDVLPNGKSQLIEHSFYIHKKDAGRLASLERRANLPKGHLERVRSGNRQEIAEGVSAMDQLATKITNSPEALSKTPKPGKVVYWIKGAERPSKGIHVITFEGKIQSIYPLSRKDWEKI